MAPYVYDAVPQNLRVQIWYILEQAIGRNYQEPGMWRTNTQNLPYQVWTNLQTLLQRERGVFLLSKSAPPDSPLDQCKAYFVGDADETGALDFIDAAFAIIHRALKNLNRFERETARITLTADEAITQLNDRLDRHSLGYQFVDGALLRRDSAFAHGEIDAPALQLLTSPGLEGPHEEFRNAHKAHMAGNTKEAIRLCLNSLESTLKAICTERKWPFNSEKDTATKLLAIVFEKQLLPDYLQSQFTGVRTTLEGGVPTLRNRAGGHGQGAVPVEVPQYLASYALHLTGAAVLLLVSAHNETPK